ncbi:MULTISPECIES: ABC transporter substrate-binding protein [Paenibacillus]|uniref:ABC transporter substrate-binding protein n=1 Tax=Paenibacillus campinasensis TaxID=66347 RepID=A0A268EQS7_9BACL|nr:MULTISPECIES: extracellular solute-binding protein [Paenibacillus]MUG65477.1 extracellular solute-binding protein [Paenibacillus campinasensis]PAD75482.1 ABC transporter substrate-binding protein [Paenibacillus campinasensis]PAK51468.1 ABC transporter substrate-binding protein [Paenibacillus sp. 7541]
MRLGVRIISGLLLLIALTACSSQADTGRVQIEFFQNKPEAKGTFDALVDKFNQSQSDITVIQVNPPDAETVLKTRVVKNDIPDIIGMGATDTYSLLAQSGIFMDVTNSPLLEQVDATYVQMLKDVSGMEEVTGIPFSTNANGIMYNRQLFEEMGLTVPETWDELLAVAQKVKDEGKIPFYFTYKDDWQTVLPFNALASNLEGIEFYLQRREDQVTFADRYREVAEKQLALMDYGHGDNFGKSYADGNRDFARGESVMYIQGTWAIPEIRKSNPDIEIGFFPFPTGNDPQQNKLISGVDTLLAVAEDSPHQEEALRFIEFLLEPENSEQYITEQTLFSTVKGVKQDDPAVAELQPYLEQGRVVDFADHYIPAAVQLSSIVQSFLQNGDIDAYLRRLDTEWDKVADRR